MATIAGRIETITLPVATATVLTRNKLVRLGGTGGTLSHSGAAAKDVIGVVQESSTNQQDAAVNVAVIGNGAKLKAEAGGTITVGAFLTSNAAGEVIATTTANQPFIGIALGAADDGDVVSFVAVRGVV